VAASLQIALAEWWSFRGQRMPPDAPGATPPPVPAEG
jgi:hypothetical protein